MTLLAPPRLKPVDRNALASASNPPGFGGAVPWSVAQLRDYADLIGAQHSPLRVRGWRLTRGGLQRPIHECTACVHTWPCRDERWRRTADTVLPWLADDDPVITAAAAPPPAGDPSDDDGSGHQVQAAARPRGRHAAPPPRRSSRPGWAAAAAGLALGAALAAALWFGLAG